MRKTAIVAMLVAAAVLAIGLVGCHVTSDSRGFATIGEVGDASFENGRLTIILDSNPTTGYSWTATESGDGFTQVSDEYTEKSSDADGAGGTQTYVYDFSSAGTFDITLDYAQSWEAASDDLHYDLSVIVNDNGLITGVVVS